jgi:hypothetical protein
MQIHCAGPATSPGLPIPDNLAKAGIQDGGMVPDFCRDGFEL